MEQLECHRRDHRASGLSLLSHPCPRSCGFCCVSAPRVYIYPDEEFERGSRKLPPLPLRFANGSRVAPHSFLADQGLLKVIHDNLQPMLTSQPSRADVFFAFITPYGPPYHEYTPSDHAEMDAMGSPNASYIPNYMRLRLKRQCAVVHEPNLEWTRRLTHLTPANARRHFVLAETPPALCHLEPEFRSRRIPSQMARLLLQLDVDNLHSRSTRRKLQIPYVSSIRWSRALEMSGARPPWQRPRTAIERPLRVAFTGSLNGRPQSIYVRTRLVEQCRRHPGCEAQVETQYPIGLRQHTDPYAVRGALQASNNMAVALALKARSVFCLEPQGFSPPRKSTIDSILLGCIPVMFYSSLALEQLLPFHFAPWRLNASLNFRPRFLTENPSFNVLDALEQISDERIHRMQQTIAEHAHKLVYDTDGTWKGGAVEQVLRALMPKSHDCA
ncbi:hypothetical protein AB1Y20_007512 [Prymnesium parvum]|uniref:Exostosin GT47 domain-containing protein n=1 Tax=Prymnesium parvum TaxID=97485 RepID=A0AB34IXQ0_PRYPA